MAAPFMNNSAATGASARGAGTISDSFADLEDPRMERTKHHKLLDIIVLSICAVIAGADGWTSIEAFGKAKLAWLQTFLELPGGIPSHDTLGRVFARLDPEAFQRSFLRWVQTVSEVNDGQVIAIDGKCLRRSHAQGVGKEAIHMISAWATQNHLVLGQRKVDTKSNEITAIPELLKVLALSGCIVTIDAMGCQKAIAKQIRDQGADYVLALKDNQPHLHEDVQSLFTWADNIKFANLQYAHTRTVHKGHGRRETRECWVLADAECLPMIAGAAAWSDLRAFVRVEARRQVGDSVTCETRYYVSSLAADTPDLATTALNAVRSHWGIENQLHWVLDIAFREDDSRIRQGYAAENMAVLRHMALNLLKQEKSQKVGVKNKRLIAAWNNDYLLKVLSI